jgi:leucine dehydrogenase
MDDLFEELETAGGGRMLLFSDPGCGLRAVLVIDDVTLGPAAGGIRTRAYPSVRDAARDALGLARAMTLKCSIAGLDAGGAKMVVIDHPGLDRSAAFKVLGDRVEELGGLFVTAGDAGTRTGDLEVMAERTRYVHVDHGDLSGAVAEGLLGCVEACAEVRGRDGVEGLRVAIQGCGAIGAAAARRLSAAGVSLLVADIVEPNARTVAAETGAEVVRPEEILTVDVDVLSPCALGGVIDEALVPRLRAWAVCGAANNILAGPGAGRALAARGILFVPDFIASAGAVVAGVCDELGTPERTTGLIAQLRATAVDVLREAADRGVGTTEVAMERARRRIAEANPV